MPSDNSTNRTVIGSTETVDFINQKISNVPARIDTGARTNSLWASDIKLSGDKISFKLFGQGSEYFTGDSVEIEGFDETVVSSSIGLAEKRYKIELPIRLGGRRIKASFTLADRSKQVYPILIGRNTLRGKFVVDVKGGTLLQAYEHSRTAELRKMLDA